MGDLTLAELVTEAAQGCNIPAPDTVIAATSDLDAQLFLRFANEAGRRLVRRHPWNQLITEKTYTTVGAALQTSAIPADFDRMIEGTLWNRTLAERYVGPLNSQQWQAQQIEVGGSPVGYFMLRGSNLYVVPTPTAGQTAAFEYVSKFWVISDGTGSADQTSFEDDTDTNVFDDEVMVLELIWRWKAHKGLEYGEDFRKAEEAIEERIGSDQPMTILNMGGNRVLEGPPYDPTYPDASWDI